MVFHLKFISIFFSLILTGLLVYSVYGMQGFPGWKNLIFMDSLSPVMNRPIKKKPVSKKPIGMEPSSSEANQEYTFFEILMDPQLIKQVDLNGKLMKNLSQFPEYSEDKGKKTSSQVIDPLDLKKSQPKNRVNSKWTRKTKRATGDLAAETKKFLVRHEAIASIFFLITFIFLNYLQNIVVNDFEYHFIGLKRQPLKIMLKLNIL